MWEKQQNRAIPWTHMQSINTVIIYKYHQFKILLLLTTNCLQSQEYQIVVLFSPFPNYRPPSSSSCSALWTVKKKFFNPVEPSQNYPWQQCFWSERKISQLSAPLLGNQIPVCLNKQRSEEIKSKSSFSLANFWKDPFLCWPQLQKSCLKNLKNLLESITF